MRRAWTLLAMAGALGCSGSNGNGVSSSSSGGSPDGDALYEAPSAEATPDVIHGLWGGAANDGGIDFDIRIRLTPTQLTEAVRCTRGRDSTPTASVSVKARVSNDEIAVLESKTDERRGADLSCKAAPRPASIARCKGDRAIERDCFTLSGTSLVMYGESPFETLRLTKLSD